MKPIQTEIVRSYSRKIQNPSQQYENFDFFSSHKEVYAGEVSSKQKNEISARLYQDAKLDVECEIAKWKIPELVVRAKVDDYLKTHNYIN